MHLQKVTGLSAGRRTLHVCCTFRVGRNKETRGGCPGPTCHGQECTEMLLSLEMILCHSGISMAQTGLSIPGWWPGRGCCSGLGSSASALHTGCGVGFISANEVNPAG